MNIWRFTISLLVDKIKASVKNEVLQRNESVKLKAEYPLRLTYVIGTYPLLTTTFIDNEILGLRKKGIDLQVLAIRPPGEKDCLSQKQRRLQKGIIYLLPVSWFKFIISHLYFFLLHPFCYFKSFFYLLTRPHPSIKARIKTSLHFAEGVYAAYLLRKQQFDVLHAHFPDRAATVALVVGRFLRKPYSISVHAGFNLFEEKILLCEKIAEAKHVTTCTAYSKLKIEHTVGQEFSSKISCVYHGLDLSAFFSISPAPRGLPLVLTVGRLKEKKGLAFLIRACQILKDRGYDFTCQIVGEGPQRGKLEDLIAQMSLENTVHLCGELPHEQVIDLYRQATMFVLPCVQASTGDLDGIPNVLAEAMAMQVPVITSRISGIPELVEDQVNGLLTPPKDVSAIADAMEALLDKSVLRERFIENGLKTVKEKFDIEHNVHKLVLALWSDEISGSGTNAKGS